MDLLCLTVLLCNIWYITSASALRPVLHEDYSTNPPVSRNCIEVQCPCGTEPRICDTEGGKAECIPCPDGTFQNDFVSSTDISYSRQCRQHETCSEGWSFVCCVDALPTIQSYGKHQLKWQPLWIFILTYCISIILVGICCVVPLYCRVCIFLMAFCTLVLKPKSLPPYPSIWLRLISWNYDHSLFGSHWRW